MLRVVIVMVVLAAAIAVGFLSASAFISATGAHAELETRPTFVF